MEYMIWCAECQLDKVIPLRHQEKNESDPHFGERAIEMVVCYHTLLSPMCPGTEIKLLKKTPVRAGERIYAS